MLLKFSIFWMPPSQACSPYLPYLGNGHDPSWTSPGGQDFPRSALTPTNRPIGIAEPQGPGFRVLYASGLGRRQPSDLVTFELCQRPLMPFLGLWPGEARAGAGLPRAFPRQPTAPTHAIQLSRL